MSTLTILIALHSVFAALWFAGPLFVAVCLHEAEVDGVGFLRAAIRARRAEALAMLGNFGVLASGIALAVGAPGGWRACRAHTRRWALPGSQPCWGPSRRGPG